MKTFMKLLLVAVATFLNLAPATPANQLRSQDQEKKWEEMEIWGDICKKTISWLSDANDLAGAECDRLADSLLSLHKPSVRSYLIAAQVANLREKPNKAISILEELISKYPNENAIIMSHPVKIVGRFWIATIAKQSGDIVKAKDVYENLLSILSTAENVKGVRDKGGLSLTMICNLYLAEIESLHLKRNDVALARLAQLSQLGTEIGTFDSGRAVSFHHKAACSVDGYTPLAVAALAISRSACPILFAVQVPAGCVGASQVFAHQSSVSAHLSS